MSRLAEMVRPDVFIMTKIGYAHLDALGDLDGVLRAKTETFAYMKQDGIAVLNGDDERLWGYDPGMRKITFGLDERNDYRAENVRIEGTDAVVLDIVSDSGRLSVKVPAYGIHIASLALCAAVVGQLFGVTGDEISRGLLTYEPVDGRAKLSSDGNITLIDDCYNANPNSVKAALSSLSELQGRRVAILGDMLDLGRLSEGLHREIGAFAAQSGIDSLICCGDKAALTYEGFKSAGGESAVFYPRKAELIAALPRLIKKDDAVLVKASNGMKFCELLPVLRGL